MLAFESRSTRDPVADFSEAASDSLAAALPVGASGTSIELRCLVAGDLLLRVLSMRVSASGVGSTASRRFIGAVGVAALGVGAANSLRNVAPDVLPRSPLDSAGRIGSGETLSVAGDIDSGEDKEGRGSLASLRDSAAIWSFA